MATCVAAASVVAGEAAAVVVSVEHLLWNSALARLSCAALVRSAAVILYFLAAAFSTLSAIPSFFSVSICDVSEKQAGSVLGFSGIDAVVVSEELNRLLPSVVDPSLAQPPSIRANEAVIASEAA